MKRTVMVSIALMSAFAATFDAAAAGRRDCDELKREIAAKIEANGVRSYALQIVDRDAASSGTLVGSCDGGTRRIAYRRLELASAVVAAAVAADASRPR